MEQIRVIKELRDEFRQLRMRGADKSVRPVRYMVWENVVGALSSNGGDDFRVVLEETAKVKDENAHVPRPNGKWANAGVILGNGFSMAWRITDNQYWGTPQRRRRICLLADFDGNTAPKILFELRRETIDTETEQTFLDFRGESRSEVPIECESLRRNTETCGEQGKGTATAAQGNPDASISFQERAGCPGGGKGILIQNEKTASLSTLTNQFGCNSSGEEIAGTLDANYYKGCGTRRGHEREVVCVGNGQLMQAKESPVVGALNCMHDQQAVLVEEPVLLESNQNHATVQTDGISTALPASMGMGGGYVPMVTYGLDRASFNQGKNAKYDFAVEEEKAQPLVARGPGGGTSTVGSLCARDYKGVGNQYVNEGKCIIQRI